MTAGEKSAFLLHLDDELLKGSAVVSEYSAFLIRETDIAFCGGAHLATVFLAQAAIECHIRFEASDGQTKQTSFQLIDTSDLAPEFKERLHLLRRFRNRWVHIENPSNDSDLQQRPDHTTQEIEAMAVEAVKVLRMVIYQWQGT